MKFTEQQLNRFKSITENAKVSTLERKPVQEVRTMSRPVVNNVEPSVVDVSFVSQLTTEAPQESVQENKEVTSTKTLMENFSAKVTANIQILKK